MATASATAYTNILGDFKVKYADKIKSLVPEAAKFQKLVPFENAKKTGKFYAQPVVLNNESGFTYASGGNIGTAYSLNDPIPMNMPEAEVSGSEITLNSAIPQGVITRAQNGDSASFEKATSLVVENMVESSAKRLETSLLYGGVGIGVTSSTTLSGSGATTSVVQITTASWATGIYAGAETSQVQFYNGSSLVSSGADSVFTITAIDTANFTITVTGTSTGTTALAALTATALNVYWNGSFGNEMIGLDSISTNAGTLFNISAVTYNLWAGNTYTVSSGGLTFAKLQAAVAKPVQRGLNTDVVVLVNPNTWNDLQTDIAALRRYEGSDKVTDSGSNGIKYFSQNGTMEIVPYNMIKNGVAYVFPKDRLSRIGSSDISFQTASLNGQSADYWWVLPSNNGIGLRTFTDQALFCDAPSHLVKITGITNTSNS